MRKKQKKQFTVFIESFYSHGYRELILHLESEKELIQLIKKQYRFYWYAGYLDPVGKKIYLIDNRDLFKELEWNKLINEIKKPCKNNDSNRKPNI